MTIAQCGNICLTADALGETDRAQVLVSVPKKKIRSVTLRNGFKVAHPILQILMGLVLVAIGGLPVLHVFRWATTGGTFVILEAAAAPLAILGVWQIASAVVPGYFLQLQLDDASRKLAFGGGCIRPAIEAFLASVEHRWNISVDREA